MTLRSWSASPSAKPEGSLELRSIPSKAERSEEQRLRSRRTDERIQAALEDLRSWATDDPVADLLEHAASLQTSASLNAFTETQEDVLAEAGMAPVEGPPLAGPAAEALIEQVSIRHEAYTTAQVAEMLGVTPGRVRQHSANRTPMAWKASGRAYYPRFHFTAEGQLLPGWASVAPHFPSDVHPVAVGAFLHRVSEELEIAERRVCPFEWLSAGGEPGVVADLVDDGYRIA